MDLTFQDRSKAQTWMLPVTKRLTRLDRNNILLASAVLLAISWLMLFLCEDRRVVPFDEGVILAGADRVSAGALVHRDFYFNYGPAQLYILSWLFKIFSPSVWVERGWDAMVKSIVVALVFLICSRLGSRRAAWIAAIAALICITHFGFYGYPVFPTLAAAFAGVVCLLPLLQGSRSARWSIAAGVCAGIAVLFRYDVGLALFVAEAAVLSTCVACQRRNNARRGREVILAALPFSTGLALLVVPLGAAYLWFDVAHDFLFDVVIFPARSYVAMRSLPFPGISAIMKSPSEAAVYLPLIVVGAIAPAMLAVWRRREGDLKFWLLLLLSAITAVFYAKGFVRPTSTQMGMAIISSLALLALAASGFSSHRRRMRLALGGAIVAAGLCTLSAGYGDLKRAKHNVASWAHAGGCLPTAGIDRLGCYTADEDRVQAIQYIRRMTAPDAYLFVGNGRHDKIFINDLSFYFLAGRPSATKWYQFDPGLQTTAPIQRAMVVELRRRCPPYIVLESEWDDVKEPNRSAESSGVTILDDYIHAHFVPVAKFGMVQILRSAEVRERAGRAAASGLYDRGHTAGIPVAASSFGR